MLAFFAEVARRASRSPALHAYDVWSEPAVMNWALPAYVPNAQYCYCPHSMARFREWLRAKVHEKGTIKLAPAIVKDVVGDQDLVGNLLAYLWGRHGALYGVTRG